MLLDKSLPFVVMNSQQGSMEKYIYEIFGIQVDHSIFFDDVDKDSYQNNLKNKNYLAKNIKVLYNESETYTYLHNIYMKQSKQDINLFTNWRFQTGNQGNWPNDHKRFKKFLGNTGTMVAHAPLSMLTKTQESIYQNLVDSDTSYIGVGTEKRFIPPIGIRSGYYVTSNRPSKGKTLVKGYDGITHTVNLKDYPGGLPITFDSKTISLMTEICKATKDTFNHFREQLTLRHKSEINIMFPKAMRVSWDKKICRLSPNDPTPPTSMSLIFALGTYSDLEKKSLCSQMDLSITRAWLAINGLLDRRSAGSLCRNIPMWNTGVVYDDEIFYTNYPAFNKHRDVICEYASKVKTNV